MNPKKSLTALSTAALLTLAACSGSDDDSTAGPTPTSTSATPTADAEQEATAPTSDSLPQDAVEGSPSGTPITLTVGDQTITARLNDSRVSQDFVETLPATLPWYRNYDIEFITELAAPLTEAGPFYTDVQPGDLVYYNPMDSVTIIYEETSRSPR